ncbi:MAG: lytic transglycosylase domain-containing protein [Blastochloris sp.]|nr:lytic transglycosylase domain-containing protein [Blastochloris sp.]
MVRKLFRSLGLILGVLLPPVLVLAAVWWWGSVQREEDRHYNIIIKEAAEKYQLDPLLIRAVIWRESDFDSGAYGMAEERGLMQVTPIAAGEWAKAENIQNFRNIDLFDPRTGIFAGSWYLSRAISRWEATDRPLIFGLAEYNAGRTHARRWSKQLPEESAALFIEQIDFPTTKAYILDILERYHYYQQHPDPSVRKVIMEKISGYWWRWMERRQVQKIKAQRAQESQEP